jgi:hypothetical protein
MSFIQEFSKWHIGLKASVLTIAAQMPFFFISIYLFKRELIERVTSFLTDMDLYFIISIAFCFSLTWFFMNVVLTLFATFVGDKMTKSKSDSKDIFYLSSIYSIGYLCLAIALNYKLHFSFQKFIFLAYSFLIFRILWLSLASLLVWKASNK